MKILRTFKSMCKKCGKDREYCETESELGWIDIACTRWCACNPKLIVAGVNEKPPEEGS